VLLFSDADIYFSRQPELMGLVIFLSGASSVGHTALYKHKPGRSGVLKSSRFNMSFGEHMLKYFLATVPCTP
jgi:hypothetical protein